MHRIVATIPDQSLEPADIARHHGRVQPDEVAIAFDGVRADDLTKLEKVAWRRFCLAWASKWEPHRSVESRSRGWGEEPRTAQITQQCSELLFGRLMTPSGPVRTKRPKKGKDQSLG